MTSMNPRMRAKRPSPKRKAEDRVCKDYRATLFDGKAMPLRGAELCKVYALETAFGVKRVNGYFV